LQAILVLVVGAILLLVVGGVGQSAARRPARVVGALAAALAASLIAAAFGAWSPVGIPFALGLVAGAAQAARPSLIRRRLADVLVVLACGAMSVPRLSASTLVIAAAVVLAAGAMIDHLARSASPAVRRALVVAAAAIGGVALALALWAGLVTGPWCLAMRAPLHIGITPAHRGEIVKLPSGAVAWLDIPAGAQEGQGALFFHGANPAGSHQPAALGARRAIQHAGYAVLAVDHPGFGESPPPPLDAPIAGWDPFPAEEAAVAALVARGFTRVTAVGHSLGSRSAVRLAVRAPARLECVVICGAATHGPAENVPYWYGRFHQDRRLHERIPMERYREINDAYYNTGRLVRSLPVDHAPILFLRFEREHADIAATRDSLYEEIPGRKAAVDLASGHYFDSDLVRGILVGDTRVARAFASLLRTWHGEASAPGATPAPGSATAPSQ
jgi:pimeloyl-ACP methyl ester carboxylesterase